MFVALIDTRPRWEPEPPPEPERPRRRRPAVPWRGLAVLLLVVGLFVAAAETGGVLAYGLVLAGVTVGSLAVDRAFGYMLGITEHRQ